MEASQRHRADEKDLSVVNILRQPTRSEKDIKLLCDWLVKVSAPSSPALCAFVANGHMAHTACCRAVLSV